MFFSNKKIDIVYLWVDSSDEKWKIKKYNHDKNLSNKLTERYLKDYINNQDRYCNHNELKYSLRSLEKYANWINNVYIITDNQVPEWLNTDNKRIHIIDHSEIMPPEALPTYNSNAIEHCVSNIKSLQENFLLANDDFFFYNKTKPSFFFKHNTIVMRIYPWTWTISKVLDAGLYEQSMLNAYSLVHNNNNINKINIVDHNIIPCKKSIYKQCHNKYKSHIENTINNHYRTNTDINKYIYLYYAVENQKGIIKKMACDNISILCGNHKFFNFADTLLLKIFKKINFKYGLQIYSWLTNGVNEIYNTDTIKDDIIFKYSSKTKLKYILKYLFVETIFLDHVDNFINKVLTVRPNLFCINNYEEKNGKTLENQLEILFPDKSEFEK